MIPFLRRIYVIHQHGHHYAIFPTWRYVTNGPVLRHPILSGSRSDLHRTHWSNLRINLAHFAFYMVLGSALILWPAWLATGHVTFVAGLLAALVVVSDLFVRVHDAIHYPREFPWLQRQGWFRFLDQHHYVHHVDTSVNLNFLLPLADLLFGTMRRTLTEEEQAIHGPLAEAKATPLKISPHICQRGPLDHVMRVAGVAQRWGRVVQHNHGYRAEYARVVQLPDGPVARPYPGCGRFT